MGAGFGFHASEGCILLSCCILLLQCRQVLKEGEGERKVGLYSFVVVLLGDLVGLLNISSSEVHRNSQRYRNCMVPVLESPRVLGYLCKCK